MKKKFSVFVVLVCVAASFCLTAAPGEKISSEIDTKMKIFSDYFLGGEPPGNDCKEGIKALVETIILMLPRAGYGEEVNNQVISANELFNKSNVLNPKGVQLLKNAYRSINDGKDFQIPEISNRQEAVEYGEKWFKLSREKLKQGKVDQAAKLLLDIVLMSVTPVEKKS